MPFILKILGSSSALPTIKRNPSAHVLNVRGHFYLIDCGEGTQLQMRRYSVKMQSIKHIFISHLHGDHFFGLFGLISTYALLNRKNDLHIYAPGNLKELFENKSLFPEELPYELILHQVDAKEHTCILDDKFVKVFSIPLKHRVPTCGFLFEEKPKEPNIKKEAIAQYNLSYHDIKRIKVGEEFFFEGDKVPEEKLLIPAPKPRKYAYCSDTRFTKSIVPYLKDVDLLYHEATYGDEFKKQAKSTNHSTASQAAEIAKQANAKRLLIGHFSSRYKDVLGLVNEAKAIFENTESAEDGMIIEI